MYNLTTYPNLVGLLEQLGVDTEPSDMSFGLSIDGGALEWGSRGLGAIFAQRINMFSPSFLRMVWDVIRFGREAPEVTDPCAQAHGRGGNGPSGSAIHLVATVRAWFVFGTPG